MSNDILTVGKLKELLATVPDHTAITICDGEYGDRMPTSIWRVPRFRNHDKPIRGEDVPDGPRLHITFYDELPDDPDVELFWTNDNGNLDNSPARV